MVSELKVKLELEESNRQKKIEALKGLDTLKLIKMLPDLETRLEAALRAENSFRDLNVGYLATADRDCAEVKRMMAELAMTAPDNFPDGSRKMTVPDRENWLTKQRTDNKALANAIERQHSVSFYLENARIDIEMAKKKLENIHKILELRTAQIQFLTEH